MHELKMLKKKLLGELISYNGVQQVSREMVGDVRDLGQAIHYLNKICDHEEMDGGASMRGGSYRGSYEGSYDGSYEDGASTRRGRDSMGRFVSRDMGPRGSAREYGASVGSYDDEKAALMGSMEKLRRRAQSDPEMMRALDQCMDRIERM